MDKQIHIDVNNSNELLLQVDVKTEKYLLTFTYYEKTGNVVFR